MSRTSAFTTSPASALSTASFLSTLSSAISPMLRQVSAFFKVLGYTCHLRPPLPHLCVAEKLEEAPGSQGLSTFSSHAWVTKYEIV